MTAADGVLLVILGGMIAYTLLGGADFGGGVWDLLARGAHRHRQRELVAATIGPVWEANHVWLIFVLIGLFSGFPAAFGELARGLPLPLALALLGIVLRGAAFVYRQYGALDPARPIPGTAAWGRVFAVASTITPVMLGVCGAAVATGRLTGHAPGGLAAPFRGVFPAVAGALTVAVCAYLAAVYLCREAEVRRDPALTADFRRRALAAAVVAGVLAAAGLPALAADAPLLWARLLSRAAPVLVFSALGGIASIVALWRWRFVAARVGAAVAVVSVLGGWSLAQYPDLIPGVLTVRAAAAPPQTLPVTLAVLLAGFAVTLPSLWLLLRVFGKPTVSSSAEFAAWDVDRPPGTGVVDVGVGPMTAGQRWRH